MQIYWSDVNANDSLELRFMAETAGEYEVAGIFTLGPVLGEFDWVLNGVKMKDVLNLNRDLEKVSVLKLGKYPILKGENTLVISARKNISGKTSSFSLDYLTFN